MTTEKKLVKAVDEIYRRMYLESDPPIEDLTPYYGRTDMWFLDHYLHQDRQEEIINEVLDEFKIKNKWQRRVVTSSVVLGASPSVRKKD
jgi:hypothetical protein